MYLNLIEAEERKVWAEIEELQRERGRQIADLLFPPKPQRRPVVLNLTRIVQDLNAEKDQKLDPVCPGGYKSTQHGGIPVSTGMNLVEGRMPRNLAAS